MNVLSIPNLSGFVHFICTPSLISQGKCSI